MKSTQLIIALFCCASIVTAACNADDLTCEDPIIFETAVSDFYISKYSPSYGETDVLLDTTFELHFTDSLALHQGLDHFIFLLNQFSGVSTEIPASCVRVVSGYTLQIPVVSCLGDVLEANTVYVLYLSQRLNGNTIETLSSVKGVEVSEAAFGLQYKSVSFRTIEHVAADVVPSRCSPVFGSVNVPLKPVVTIAFSSVIHIGTGNIEFRSTNFHPSSSVTVSVTDASHVILGEDLMSIQIYGISLMGNEQYQVIIDAGIVLSASGSKCGTAENYFFTTQPDVEKPYILFISPNNYKTGLPKNLQIRIAFSENIRPNSGVISFANENEDVRVNVQSAKEVRCNGDTCVIQPANGFNEGSYEMSFSESAFVDYSGNTLVEGVASHIFSVSGLSCGIEFLNVNGDEPCYCQSLENQCQCKCGETYFVKDY